MTGFLGYALLGWLVLVVVVVSLCEYTGRPLDATFLVFVLLYEPHKDTCWNAIWRRLQRKSPKQRL